MNLNQLLEWLGLPEREAKVYLALLELGDTTVMPLSKKAGIERTYCYDILAGLAHKDLVTSYERNGRQRFMAQSPDTLESQLSGKLEKLRQALPELKAKHNSDTKKPTIRFYEGKSAVDQLYRELAATKEVATIAGTSELEKNLGSTLEEIAKKLVQKKVRIRELLTPELGLPKFAKRYRKPLQEIRFLPPKTQLTTDTIIYENRVIFISYLPNIHAVVIEGSGIVSTQKTLFEQLWKNSK
ncbi:MAG: hypothetical protein NUV80_06880 [Candidatus Berkelbacteria bacterium]|nr:hypothetical protein [Candidatus Berkelbacteria bacterium]MCR4308254.1 hypothetical protein [Candidatus Berkelbacteria bacterium]